MTVGVMNNGKIRRRPAWASPLIFGVIVIAVAVFSFMKNPSVTEAVMSAMIRFAVPLMLGALCGIYCERAGIVNIGIEGQMLLSAFTAYMTNVWTGNLILALLAGALTGALLGYFLAVISIKLKLNQIIGGTVINILAIGITGFFYQVGMTTKGKFGPIRLGPLAKIPGWSSVFNNPPITYIAFLMVIISHIIFFHTRWGLRTRAVGTPARG